MYVVLMELIGQASERDPVPQPFCADDSWLTVGITGGDSSQQIGSVGLSWSDWTSHKGINDNDCGVFWMNPLKANQSASYEHNPIMLGQLTVLKSYNGNVTFGLKGKHHGNDDWRQEGLRFSLGNASAPSHPPPPPPPQASSASWNAP